MSETGFGPTLTELCEIVQDYVQLKQLKTGFVNDYHGYNWIISFLKQHKLEKSLKKGGQMQLARKNVTSDAFVLYSYYEMLKKEVKRLGIQERAECFCNCHESGFSRDPPKCTYVGPIGEPLFIIRDYSKFLWWKKVCNTDTISGVEVMLIIMSTLLPPLILKNCIL